MRETAARLAMATAVTPPPEMRSQVLAAAARTRQLPPRGSRLLGLPGMRPRLRRPPLSLAAVTTGVLALAAAVAFLLVTQASTSTQLEQARASDKAIAAVLAAPDAHIEAVPATVGGTVTAVVSVREHEAVITTTDVPPLPRTRVYQLWVMTPVGRATSAGLLTVTSPGPVTPVLASGILPGDRLGVTVEPAGGTKQPTTTPVVVMPLAT